MIRPVAGTIATRVMVTLMNIGVIMIAGHRGGAVMLGDISLVVLAITFIMLLNNVAGGGAIVYLTPRHPLRKLLIPAYAWAIVSAGLALLVVTNLPLAPEGTAIHVVVLALLQAIYTIHFNVLLGRERIHVINMLQILQALVLLAAFAVLVDRSGSVNVINYVHAAYISYGVTAIASIAVIMGLRWEERDDQVPVIGRMFRQGTFIQIANFLQLLNYRLAYYLIETFHGLGALGIYSVSNQLAESAWLGPRSIGSVLYGKVSNTADDGENQRLTVTASKICIALAVAVVAVIALLPDRVYQVMFGEEITGVTELVLLLSPGIVAMALSQGLSHYFSGVGRNLHNMIGSGIGVIVTVAVGLPLIQNWGASGAAITASAAYCANAVYQFIVFTRTASGSAMQLWFSIEDRDRIMRLLKKIR